MSLCGALVGSTAGCAALSDAGLVPSLLPLLRHADPAHAPTVAAAVRVLEAFMDFSTAAAGLFRELGGLGAMVGRLGDEVEAARAAVAPPAAPPRPRGTPPPPPAPPVPHGRRLLLKALLRAVALASYAPSAGARAQDDADAGALYACLTSLFTSADAFGGGLFALAASVLADLVHHDPLRFPALDAAGAPSAFVAAVAAGVPPAAEALCAVPSALTALCLNAAGLDRVRDAGALRFFVDVCSHPGYLRALAGDTPSILGAGLDELVRHVPSLRPDGVEAATHLLAKLARVGGVEAPPLAAPLVRQVVSGGGGAAAPAAGDDAAAPPPPAAAAAAEPMDGMEAVTPPNQQQRAAAPPSPRRAPPRLPAAPPLPAPRGRPVALPGGRVRPPRPRRRPLAGRLGGGGGAAAGGGAGQRGDGARVCGAARGGASLGTLLCAPPPPHLWVRRGRPRVAGRPARPGGGRHASRGGGGGGGGRRGGPARGRALVRAGRRARRGRRAPTPRLRARPAAPHPRRLRALPVPGGRVGGCCRRGGEGVAADAARAGRPGPCRRAPPRPRAGRPGARGGGAGCRCRRLARCSGRGAGGGAREGA